MYPDFLGIGAQKSGTTWLSHNLRLHPEIWIPDVKEVHYFDDRIKDSPSPVSRISSKFFGEDPLDRRWRRMARTQVGQHLREVSPRGLLWDSKYFLGAPDDDWYASLFEPGKGNSIGEITPAYSMLEPETVEHVHSLMPEAKLIFMVRNPIERAWSQATQLFHRSTGLGDANSVKERKLRRHFDSERSQLRTDYSRTLENWRRFYPEEKIFIGFLEDVQFFPVELIESLYAFLGVDSSFRPPGMAQRLNARSEGWAWTKGMVYLAQSYRDKVSRLAERFGGYASFWLYCVSRLIERPPEEEFIPYPLWASSMWKEWNEEVGEDPAQPRFQSGVLSSYGS